MKKRRYLRVILVCVMLAMSACSAVGCGVIGALMGFYAGGDGDAGPYLTDPVRMIPVNPIFWP